MSKEEIADGFESAEFAMNMRHMNLGEEDLSIIFDALDTNCSGSFSYTELVNELYRYRSPDLRTALLELTKLRQKVHETRNSIRQTVCSTRPQSVGSNGSLQVGKNGSEHDPESSMSMLEMQEYVRKTIEHLQMN